MLKVWNMLRNRLIAASPLRLYDRLWLPFLRQIAQIVVAGRGAMAGRSIELHDRAEGLERAAVS
jgi:hypothetical protein